MLFPFLLLAVAICIVIVVVIFIYPKTIIVFVVGAVVRISSIHLLYLRCLIIPRFEQLPEIKAVSVSLVKHE